LYSFSFAPNPDWASPYSGWREIWHYADKVARDHDCLKYATFNRKISSATWDEAAGVWRLTVENTVTKEVAKDFCHVLINGMGIFGTPAYPQIEGINSFEGKTIHTARWDHSYDLKGKRVGVIGMGASAVQLIPEIQPIVKDLYVFQRSPTWITRRALTFKYYTEEEKQKFRDPVYAKQYHDNLFQMFEARFNLFKKGSDMQKEYYDDYVNRYNEEVKDPVLREKLLPKYPVGCRRLTPSYNFFPAIQQPNVHFHTERVEEITPTGVRVAEGVGAIDLDVIVYATGYDSTMIPFFPVTGRDGLTLKEFWKHHQEGYNGIATWGFPNYFMTLGPNGFPAGSVLPTLEKTGDYCGRAIRYMMDNNVKAVMVTKEAHERFNSTIDEYFNGTVFSAGCGTWMKSKDGRISTLWPGTQTSHRATLDAGPKWSDYTTTPFAEGEKRADA